MMNNTNNGIIKFLLGYKIYSSFSIGELEFGRVVKAIDTLPIRVGVFERYVESLSYISEFFGISWSSVIEKKRVTINKPAKPELSEEEIAMVKERNSFDYLLYEKALLEIDQGQFSLLDIKIEGDKYDYVIKYTERFVLFESMINDRDFLKTNRKAFNLLNLKLHRKSLDGLSYVKEWNEEVLSAFNNSYGACELNDSLASILSDDPLEFAFEMAKCVNKHYKTVPVSKRVSVLKF